MIWNKCLRNVYLDISRTIKCILRGGIFYIDGVEFGRINNFEVKVDNVIEKLEND